MRKTASMQSPAGKGRNTRVADRFTGRSTSPVNGLNVYFSTQHVLLLFLFYGNKIGDIFAFVLYKPDRDRLA